MAAAYGWSANSPTRTFSASCWRRAGGEEWCMMASGTTMGAGGDSVTSSGSTHGYESIWNGRDELVHRPPPPAVEASAKLCRGCWRWRQLRDFEKRRICRHCVRLRNSGRLRKTREAARVRGRCQACAKRPAAAGLTICAKCRLRHREQNVDRRRRLSGEGRCVDCTAGLPSGWTGARCEACVDSSRRRMGELRRGRLAAGLCRACGKRPRAVLSGGELATQCRSCLDRAAERKRARRARRAQLGEAGA